MSGKIQPISAKELLQPV
jgi:hypothetical protein